MTDGSKLRRGVLVAVLVAVASGLLLYYWTMQPHVERPRVGEDDGSRQATPEVGVLVAAGPLERPEDRIRIDASGRDDLAPVGTIVVEVLWSDGEPARGIMVYVSSNLAYATRLQDLAASTDQLGRAIFEGVRCGPVSVRTDRAGQASVVVRGGQETRVRLQVNAGLHIQGRVENERGQPVPGALIWLTRDATGSWMSGRFVAKADDAGAFELRDVPEKQSIGAVAEGFCPSAFADLETLDTSEPRIWVVLQLTAPGGRLNVHVVDHAGRAVKDAIVAVGEVDVPLRTLTEDPRTPRAMPTDEEGRCVMPGMAPGDVPVEVMAIEHATWRGRVQIEVGRTTELSVTLPRGATVEGVVRTRDGRPVPDVLVVALPNETPGNGSLGEANGTPFGHPSAISRSDGAFELRRVPPGKVHLLARSEGRGSQGGVRPWTESSLAAGPGESLRWDAVLDPGYSIQGAIRRRSGRPLDGAALTLAKAGASRSHLDFSDANGQFAFLCLESVPYDLTIIVPNRLQGPIVERAIVPSHAMVEIVVDDELVATTARGVIRGRVVDSASRLRDGVKHWVVLRGRGGSIKAELRDRAFCFMDVGDGEYAVSIHSGADCVLSTGAFRLAPAQDLTLADLVSAPGASVIVELDRWPGTQSREVTVRLADSGTGIQYVRNGVVGDRVTFDNVVPGAYLVELEGRSGMRQTNCASSRRDIVAASGGTATCAFVVRPAVLLELQLELPPGHVVESIVCSDALGWKCVKTPRQSQSGGRSLACSLSVPVGRLSIAVRTDKGAQRQTETTIVEGAIPDPVLLQLR